MLKSLSIHFKLPFFDNKDHEWCFSVAIHFLHPSVFFFYESISKLLNMISLLMREERHRFEKVYLFILSSLLNPHQALIIVFPFDHSQVTVLNRSDISSPWLVRVQSLLPKRLPTGLPFDLGVPLPIICHSIFSDPL